MKALMAGMMAAASIAFAGVAMAADMPAAGKSKCGACHALDIKGMGPSFKDIAAKYKGDKDAVGKMEIAIAKGGAFGWNFPMAMPPKGMGATDAEVKAMAEYIAGLAH